MARRLLTALMLAALAAGAWWITRSGGHAGEGSGLTVFVEVVDLDGKPLPQAQIERVFENRRLRVDKAGRAQLANVVLRELDTPSAEALTRAVRVHAPFHALFSDDVPDVTRREDGAWAMRFQLMAHGVLRLYVGETHLGPCKAFPETDGWDEFFEAIGGRDVARHGHPASYRVFHDRHVAPDEIIVRLEGEPDGDGVIGVATRKLRVPIPAPGHVEEQVLEPEQVQVILGQVRVGDGPTPPSLAGHVIVTELPDDGDPIPLAQVRVGEDGRFIARRTGKGRYELVFHLDFFPGTTTLTVLGGASFDLTPSKPAVWARIEHPGLDLSKRSLDVKAQPANPTQGHRNSVLGGDGASLVSLPGAGTWRVQINVRGTNELPPQHVRFTAEASSGATEATGTQVEVLPHGTVVVRVGTDDFGRARGATVHLDDGSYFHEPVQLRSATLIPGLAESATFHHVTAGRREVRIVWEAEGREDATQQLDVKAGETTTWKVEAKTP